MNIVNPESDLFDSQYKTIDKKTIQKIKQIYGTPTYLYCLETILNQYKCVRNQLSHRVEIYYSMKANPLLAICQVFAKENAGCEVSSKNELLSALKAGFDPKKIIFVGPGKTHEELKLCVIHNVNAIVCDSIDEIQDLNAIAANYNKKAPVLVRLNPFFSITGAPIKMTGVASQFGMDSSMLLLKQEAIRNCQSINLLGIHIYNGSRILNAESLIDNAKNIFSLVNTLSEKTGFDFKLIDIGGGFGVPYFENEHPLDLTKTLSQINQLITEYLLKHSDTKFIIELGRYLVAESGVLVSSVMRVKTNHRKNYAIIDAGTNCHASSSGFGSFLQRNYVAKHFSRKNNKASKKIKYQVVGPLCTPNDFLLRDFECCQIKPGDMFLFFNVGAYGSTYSPSRFISHGMPAEVVEYKSDWYLARKRESFDYLIQGQQLLTMQ